MELVRVRRPGPSRRGARRQRPLAPGRWPPAPPRPAARRGRLGIGFQITGGQLRGTVEVACHTATSQAFTTLVWSGRLDSASCRVLLKALRAAARHGSPACLRVFAAAARDLFRHVSKTLGPDSTWRVRCRRDTFAAPVRPPESFAVQAGAHPLPGDMLEAINDLLDDAHNHLRGTVMAPHSAESCVGEALAALHDLFASLGTHLERVLQPLIPELGRNAVPDLILETRAELDDLASCRTDGAVYVAHLAETDSGDNAVGVEVQASLRAAGP